MSSKDEFLFRKSALMGTKSGKEILKQGILREKGYKQFYKYNNNIEERFQDFTKTVSSFTSHSSDFRS